MFGLPEVFEYFECVSCGCLQIGEPPSDLARYYPPEYGNHATDPVAAFRGPVRGALRRARDRHAVFGGGLLGRLLIRRFPEPPLQALGLLDLDSGTRVLDVGAGSGLHLYSLARLGFRHLLGVDPFIEEDRFYPPGLTIRKATIHDVEGSGCWDLVMFHHVLEHVADPVEQLRAATRLLAPGGTCLIRIPTVSSEAWEAYGTDWVQLDAPRHLFLHSRRSLSLVAEAAGLAVTRVVDDSTAFQFWGSEQVRQGVPLASERSWGTNPRGSAFTRGQVRVWEREARRLNREGRGDQAVFVLRSGV